MEPQLSRDGSARQYRGMWSCKMARRYSMGVDLHYWSALVWNLLRAASTFISVAIKKIGDLVNPQTTVWSNLSSFNLSDLLPFIFFLSFPLSCIYLFIYIIIIFFTRISSLDQKKPLWPLLVSGSIIDEQCCSNSVRGVIGEPSSQSNSRVILTWRTRSDWTNMTITARYVTGCAATRQRQQCRVTDIIFTLAPRRILRRLLVSHLFVRQLNKLLSLEAHCWVSFRERKRILPLCGFQALKIIYAPFVLTSLCQGDIHTSCTFTCGRGSC